MQESSDAIAISHPLAAFECVCVCVCVWDFLLAQWAGGENEKGFSPLRQTVLQITGEGSVCPFVWMRECFGLTRIIHWMCECLWRHPTYCWVSPKSTGTQRCTFTHTYTHRHRSTQTDTQTDLLSEVHGFEDGQVESLQGGQHTLIVTHVFGKVVCGKRQQCHTIRTIPQSCVKYCLWSHGSGS